MDDVYSPPPEHKWADLFRDIPLQAQWVGRGRNRLWVPGQQGTLAFPHHVSRLAEHAELVGFELNEEKAKIVRVGPTRGGEHLAASGRWQDVRKPVPEVNPIAEAELALGKLTPAELRQVVDNKQQELDDLR